jgi:conjugal transfer pilus assembly protein TraF
MTANFFQLVRMTTLGVVLGFITLPVAVQAQTAAAAPTPPSTSAQRPEDGHGSDYCSRQLGTWFYCDAEQAEPEPPVASPGGPAPSNDEADIAAAEKFKADMEKARLIAVWNPTEDNIRRYYAFQQQTMSKSGMFADTVRRLVWSDPSLDYTLQRPISAAAKTEWVDTRNTDRDLFFRGAYDQIGLFYIYRGSCGPCRVSSPIVREFGQRFGVVVKPISTDGAPNAEFPNFVTDHGQLKAWGITEPVTPAYLIYQKPSLDAQGNAKPISITVSDGKQIALRPCQNPKGCLTYLGAGVLSVDELADRLFVTLATQPGKDF